MKKIGIVVAMDKEFALLEDLLQNKKEVSTATFRICVGEVEGKEVCLMKSGIGKVAAATGINWMKFEYHPDMVINSGVAGGLGDEVSVGDIVAGNRCCYHDVDCGPESGHGQVQGFPAFFNADSTLLEAVSHQNVKKGLICTGDQFITDTRQLMEIKSNFPDVYAVDMESAAIAHTCFIWNIPFLSLRVISDTPGRDGDNAQQYADFWEKAPRKNFELVRALLKIL